MKKQKYKRRPCIRFGSFRIRYLQEPYIDRFYVIDFAGDGHNLPEEIGKIPRNMVERFGKKPFWFVYLNSTSKIGHSTVASKDENRLDNFLDRCREYDEYLDRTE